MYNDPTPTDVTHVISSLAQAQIIQLNNKEQLHQEMSDSGRLQHPRPRAEAGLFKERGLSILMKCLVKAHEDICAATTQAYIQLGKRNTFSHPAYKLTRFGDRVRTCCIMFLDQGDDSPDWVSDYADHQFSPVITVMLRAMKRWAADVVWWPNAADFMPMDERHNNALVAMTRLIAFIRRVSHTKKFKFACYDYSRQAAANFKSACKYVVHLFSRYTRLVVLRVDLYLRPGHRAWGFGKEANNRIERLQRLLRDGSIVPGFLGGIYKRENGIHRGMHWHCMFFLDAHDQMHADYFSKAIGDAWMRIVGGDRASYFNCYVRRHEYRFNGLGVVHLNDIEKLIGIRVALHYMTKRDCVLKATSGKQRNFSRSEFRTPVRSGAPRKDEDSLRDVKRVLSGARSRYPKWLVL
ncbi:inovirus-type Gp2 protein [Xanthomonas cannabis]|uniref:inovirus-type Gp2 protein n=1 Tax=Xanthomonas cannabis TaxID=1885674 RepID=UPI00141AA8E2|nr:inovirus-type Gp2 protein [Xanthomonas cannabis]NIK00370.1 hypothetical protein [Xanthomonas cannabis]